MCVLCDDRDADHGGPAGAFADLVAPAPSRRRFLALAAGTAAAAALAPEPAVAAPGAPRTVNLININTQERTSATYWADGRYRADVLRRLDHMLRDHRTGEVRRFDPRLFDILWEISRRLQADGPFEVYSAYRSPTTNAAKRATQRGVARNSMHMHARAIDIRLQGRAPLSVQRVAVLMRRGGVGLYRGSGFVHVDTGPVRTW